MFGLSVKLNKATTTLYALLNLQSTIELSDLCVFIECTHQFYNQDIHIFPKSLSNLLI